MAKGMKTKAPPAEPRVPPSPQLMSRRELASNGRDQQQAFDTIGKMWAWGMLWSERYAPDLLRDAGRSYAASFWINYQKTAAAKVGGYREMLGGSIAPLHIPDPLRDVILYDKFRRMDAELGGAESDERRAVARYCVDHHGHNDAAFFGLWIEQVIERRMDLETRINTQRTLKFSPVEAVRQAAKARERELNLMLVELSRERPPRPNDLGALNRGLTWLADWIEREKTKRRDIA